MTQSLLETGVPADEPGTVPHASDGLAHSDGGESRLVVPDSINEEYYQISPEILDCFPKFHYPLNLYRYKEDIASLLPCYAGGERFDNDRRSELYELCRGGLIFVSRNQHDIYTNFITQQLDMVLLDKNLRPSEIAEIFQKTLAFKTRDFCDQTLFGHFESVRKDVDILVEYLRIDPQRILDLVGHCHARCIAEYKKANVTIIGLGLCYKHWGGFDFDRLQHVIIGLLLADVGMAKIPKFVIDKAGGLRVDERKKVECHTQVGLDLLVQFTVPESETVAIVTEHHERLDGSGYPKRLRGDAISQLGRIGAVADSYCAMITDRTHATGMKPAEAAALLFKDQRRYDPAISGLLLKLLSEAGNWIKARHRP
jgi:hypothetical protein